MNEALKTLLSLSLSGSLLIVPLLLLRPLFRQRLSKRWQYYIWLVVIARLLLPFAPETNLMNSLFQGLGREIVQTGALPSPFPQAGLPSGGGGELPESPPDESGTQENAAGSPQGLPASVLQSLCLVWLLTALILLIRKITIYQSFVKYTRAGCSPVAEIDLLERFGQLVANCGIQRPVELCVNPLVSSPLLIGFFKPCIVLPSTGLPQADFQFTILHELTHHRRRDMFYKWLAQLAVCVHWFNPLVHLLSREVNRACELSCDEAVMQALGGEERRAYGDTLVNALGAGGGYQDSLASVTLSESKELLKERLEAIMKFRKQSKAAVSAALVLTLAICCGAVYAGAYAAPLPAEREAPSSDSDPAASSGEAGKTPSSVPRDVSSEEPVSVGFSGISVTGRGPVGVELVRSRGAEVTFELLNMDDEKSCATEANVADGIMRIAVHNHAAGGVNVSFGPPYQNVVRIHIPDAVYTAFDIQSTEMVIQMQDFRGPVRIEARHAGIRLIDTVIARGTYEMEVSSGPIYLEADSFLSDITANAESGPLTVRFGKMPENLYLDTVHCGPVVDRPVDWPALYKTGSEAPRLVLSNTGKALIAVGNDRAAS